MIAPLIVATALAATPLPFQYPRLPAEVLEVMRSAHWYDHHSMPRVWQDGPAVFSAEYNPAGAEDSVGHGAGEFPWLRAAGTDSSPGVSRFGFIAPPAPIVVHQRPDRSWGWRFPVGTIVGEALCLDVPLDLAWPHPVAVFEVRTRTLTAGGWEMAVYRPLYSDAEVGRWFPEAHQVEQRIDSRHGAGGFADRALAWKLQRIEPKTALAILTGRPWADAIGYDAATQNVQDFHLVPRHYFAAVAGSDSLSCMRCHEQAGQPVSTVDAVRPWRGRFPGDAGILGWHPFSKDSISYDGERRERSLDPVQLEKGIIEAYERPPQTVRN